MLPDVLAPGLDLVICGTGVGAKSAAVQHYYAHPNNQFWAVLERVGLTPTRLNPANYRDLLQYGIGLTDLVKDRAGADTETLRGVVDVVGLRQKVERYEPRIVAFNSLKAGRLVLGGDVLCGPQARSRVHGAAELWVLPSTSGAARGHWDESVWQRLGDRVAEVRM